MDLILIRKDNEENFDNLIKRLKEIGFCPKKAKLNELHITNMDYNQIKDLLNIP